MPNHSRPKNSTNHISSALANQTSHSQLANKRALTRTMNGFSQSIFDGGSSILRLFIFLNLLELVRAEMVHRGFTYDSTIYELDAYGPNQQLLLNRLFNNPCGNIEPDAYGTHDQIIGQLRDEFYLYRQGEFKNIEFESCLIKFMTDLVSDDSPLVYGIGILALVILGAALVALTKCLKMRALRREEQARNEIRLLVDNFNGEMDSEDEELSYEDSGDQESVLQEVVVSSSAAPSTSKEKKISNAEKLEAIEFPDHEIPRQFICSISQFIMTKPVIANDGNTYEREEIAKIMAMGGNCPLDRKLKVTHLTANRTLKSMIIEFVEAQVKLSEGKKLKMSR